MCGVVGLRVGALLALLGGVLCGCGADDSPSGDPAEVMCRSDCRVELRCGRADSLSSCVEICTRGWWVASRVSLDSARTLGSCFEGLTCEEANGVDRAAWNACWVEAEDKAEPTPELREMCSRLTYVWFECGGVYSTESCEEDYGIWSADTHEQILACVDTSACDDLEPCINRVLPV